MPINKETGEHRERYRQNWPVHINGGNFWKSLPEGFNPPDPLTLPENYVFQQHGTPVVPHADASPRRQALIEKIDLKWMICEFNSECQFMINGIYMTELLAMAGTKTDEEIAAMIRTFPRKKMTCLGPHQSPRCKIQSLPNFLEKQSIVLLETPIKTELEEAFKVRMAQLREFYQMRIDLVKTHREDIKSELQQLNAANQDVNDFKIKLSNVIAASIKATKNTNSLTLKLNDLKSEFKILKNGDSTADFQALELEIFVQERAVNSATANADFLKAEGNKLIEKVSDAISRYNFLQEQQLINDKKRLDEKENYKSVVSEKDLIDFDAPVLNFSTASVDHYFEKATDDATAYARRAHLMKSSKQRMLSPPVKHEEEAYRNS